MFRLLSLAAIGLFSTSTAIDAEAAAKIVAVLDTLVDTYGTNEQKIEYNNNDGLKAFR